MQKSQIILNRWIVNGNIQALARTTAASSEEISTIGCVCMCVELIQKEKTSGDYLAVVTQSAHLSPMHLRKAQVWLSLPHVRWFTRDASETWPLACSLSLTAALQQSYTRTADLHQRCSSPALLHLIKVLAYEQKGSRLLYWSKESQLLCEE